MLADPTVSILGSDPAHRNCVLNGNAFQQDAIRSFGGWQYACFYSSLASSDGDVGKREPLYVHVSRRKLPGGPWETLVLKDYPQTTDDGHNTVQLGICPGDGTIHLSYDHHCDVIRYRYSQTGVAHDPEAFSWDAALFGGHLSRLPGLGPEHDQLFSYVTYPRFLPLGPNLLFSFRTGKAGLGDDHLCSYEPQSPASSSANTTTDLAATPVGVTADARLRNTSSGDDGGGSGNRPVYAYTLLGTHLQGVSNNPYVHGLDYRGGQLHATWVWRGFVWYAGWDDARDEQHKAQAGPNSAANNYDICHAYSDDGGRTWRNGAGYVVADLRRGQSVRPDAPGITAFAIPKAMGLANQEAQALDRAGGVHVLNRDATDGTLRWKHYYRSPEGTWSQRPLPYVCAVVGGRRGRLAVSRDDALYLILPEASSSAAPDGLNAPMGLTILRTTKADGYAQYERVWQRAAALAGGEPLVDTGRLEDEDVLSVFTRIHTGSGALRMEVGKGVATGEGETEGVAVAVLDFQL
ncbi:hypothetical protein GGS23DRAFT_354012 [Durotheca rogersii]|uniref:uncharacterized protein n=1 Tax=Durotheca rogersii TaxID=419775 RepID=UPI002220A0B6|nr:uncharacterized protein GGS23DRAFT_354012 [Durotheca rogersii]KAI5865765.1 hypothetical protein GGS23DRAFT_354012 [Durotheca rogersii]